MVFRVQYFIQVQLGVVDLIGLLDQGFKAGTDLFPVILIDQSCRRGRDTIKALVWGLGFIGHVVVEPHGAIFMDGKIGNNVPRADTDAVILHIVGLRPMNG